MLNNNNNNNLVTPTESLKLHGTGLESYSWMIFENNNCVEPKKKKKTIFYINYNVIL